MAQNCHPGPHLLPPDDGHAIHFHGGTPSLYEEGAGAGAGVTSFRRDQLWRAPSSIQRRIVSWSASLKGAPSSGIRCPQKGPFWLILSKTKLMSLRPG